MTDLTDEQLADLAAKAEAATPGDWQYRPDPGEGPWWVYHVEGIVLADAEFSSDAQWIAAADPQTVGALVTEVVRRRAAMKRNLTLTLKDWERFVTSDVVEDAPNLRAMVEQARAAQPGDA